MRIFWFTWRRSETRQTVLGDLAILLKKMTLENLPQGAFEKLTRVPVPTIL